jgi:hypothetical protein
MPQSALPGLTPILVVIFNFTSLCFRIKFIRLFRISLRTAPQMWMVIYYHEAMIVADLHFLLT